MLIINATVPMEEQFISGMRVRLEGGCIAAIGGDLSAADGEKVIDLSGDYLLPGFVDVHIHAYRGQDTMTGESAVRAMSRELYDAAWQPSCPPP